MTVFVIGPIGENGSEVRHRSDELKEHIIVPALDKALGSGDYRLERADEIAESGRITNQIMERLLSSDLVIIDLAGLNPNVMYEYGIRQASGNPFVVLRPIGQPLPFDVADFRAVEYSFELSGGRSATNRLAEQVKSATQSTLSDINSRNETASSAGDRSLAKVMDDLTELRSTAEATLHFVYQMHQAEERQREDLKEMRAQEIGLQVFGMLGNDPDKIIGFMNAMNQINSAALPVQESE